MQIKSSAAPPGAAGSTLRPAAGSGRSTARSGERASPGTRREWMLGYLLIAPALLITATVLVYPLLFNLNIAVREWSWSSPADAPKPFVGLRNFMDLAESGRFWGSLRLSLLFVAAGVVAQYALGLGLALLLNQEFRGRRVFRAIFILPMVLAPIVVGIQWKYLLSSNFGILNYLLARVGIDAPSWLSEPRWGLPILVVVDTWTWVPFVALILLAGLQQVPQEVYEAAELDGAGSFARFRDVTLPLLRPATAIVLLLRGTEIFRSFDTVYVLTGGGPGRSTEVLGLYLYRIAFSEGNLGVAAALAVVVGVIGMAIGAILIASVRTETSLF